jgi:xanthosine utilization system XapX-like protein
MDVFVILIAGILTGIIFAVVAFRKKSKWNILIFGIIGFLIGLLIGYFLAPFFISFK